MNKQKPIITALKKESGFSLVELAIALVIIGLLIGGLLKGTEVIENARVASVVTQVSHYDAAFRSFKSAYGDLPGDIRDASRVRNCAGYCATSGNGNGMIQEGLETNWHLAGQASGGEQSRAWMQLARADLITTVDNTNNSFARAAGVDFPAMPFRNGVYDVMFWNSSTTGIPVPIISGHYIKTKSVPVTSAGPASLSAKQAGKIDAKVDDGMPSSGTVLGWRANKTHCQVSATVRSYPHSNRAERCELSFKMNF